MKTETLRAPFDGIATSRLRMLHRAFLPISRLKSPHNDRRLFRIFMRVSPNDFCEISRDFDTDSRTLLEDGEYIDHPVHGWWIMDITLVRDEYAMETIAEAHSLDFTIPFDFMQSVYDKITKHLVESLGEEGARKALITIIQSLYEGLESGI